MNKLYIKDYIDDLLGEDSGYTMDLHPPFKK